MVRVASLGLPWELLGSCEGEESTAGERDARLWWRVAAGADVGPADGGAHGRQWCSLGMPVGPASVGGRQRRGWTREAPTAAGAPSAAGCGLRLGPPNAKTGGWREEENVV